jgi:methyl-accepting chemotaxis protein
MLPDMVRTVESGFETWREAGEQVGLVVQDSGQDIRAVAADARVLSGQLKQLMRELTALAQRADRIVADIELTAEELPSLISDSHALVRGANDITDRVNRHWLLGGGQSAASAPPAYMTHPAPPASEPAERPGP